MTDTIYKLANLKKEDNSLKNNTLNTKNHLKYE